MTIYYIIGALLILNWEPLYVVQHQTPNSHKINPSIQDDIFPNFHMKIFLIHICLNMIFSENSSRILNGSFWDSFLECDDNNRALVRKMARQQLQNYSFPYF